MSSLNEFKSIADEIMDEIIVTNELKEKTLNRCKKRRNNWTKIAILPAACAILLVIGLYHYHFLKPGSSLKAAPAQPQETNLMMADSNVKEGENSTLPAKRSKITAEPVNPNTSFQIATLEDAKKYLDGAVLTPSYIPSGFTLNGIQAIAPNGKSVASIWLFYTKDGKSFTISMESGGEWKDFTGYTDVDINGAPAHIKSQESTEFQSSEIRWFIGKILYSIEGSISKEDTIKIARSLK